MTSASGWTRAAAHRAGWACALALAVAAPIAAQSGGDSVIVSVLTMGPGDEVFERFGHDALRIHDLRTGFDSAYNWGMFTFEQPHFLQRFLTGDTKYWVEAFPTLFLIKYYHDAGRAVVEQELAMTPAEKDSLRRFVEWNVRAENRFYRYDYYRDNCATRLRDALDGVLGGWIRRSSVAKEHGVTYRSETLRLAAAYPALNFGMDFALGARADATLSAWDETFVPMRLRDLLREVRVRHADGSAGALVSAERVLVTDDRYVELAAPPNLLSPALVIGLALAGAVLVLSVFQSTNVAARWALGAIGAGWHGVAGAAGLLVLCLGLFTHHVYMGRNANLLLATPASLLLALLFPRALARASSPRVVRAALGLSMLAALFAVLAVVLRLAVRHGQESQPLLALAVPLQLALAFALWRSISGRALGER